MRPRTLLLTSTLSTLSSAISKVRRLIRPVLWTTRRLVTSVSVAIRWNQALIVQYNATSATTAAEARQSRTTLSMVVAVSYTHLRAHETDSYLVCRLLLEK